MKKIIFLSILIICHSTFLSAQLKVQSDGSVSVGSLSTDYSSKLFVAGSKITLFGTNSQIWTANNSLAYGFGSEDVTGYFYANINSPVKIMSFNSSGCLAINSTYAATNTYYKLYVNGPTYCTSGVWSASDERFKQNIQNIDSPLSLIKQLNGKKYKYKENFLKSTNTEDKFSYGLIAQETKNVIPDLVSQLNDSINSYAINYTGFIPILIEAIKEQQKQIEELKKVLANEQLVNLKSTNENNSSSLDQNFPNPFSKNTIITFSISKDSQKASINIYDMNGTQIKSLPVENKGKGTIVINGAEFRPGIYLYTLIVNDKEISTKRMILTD